MSSSPPPEESRKGFWATLGAAFAPGGAPFAWLMIAVLTVLITIFISLVTKGSFLDHFTDPSRMRGFITALIAFGTLIFALILIVQAYVGQDAKDEATERHRRAREVFNVFTGILGTIVGFYFGSAQGEAEQFGISGARIVDIGGGAVVAQVENGTPPYRYRITFSDATPPIERDLASAEWIFEPVTAARGVTAIVSVTDARNKEASAEARRPQEARNPAAAPPAASEASPRPPPATTLPPRP